MLKNYYYDNIEEIIKWRNLNIPFLGIPSTFKLDRIDDINKNYDIKICIYGCSFAYGDKLPVEETFGHLIKKHFESQGKSVGLFNFGIIGGSNDLISRMVICTIPLIKPNFSIVSFSFPERREGIDNSGVIRTIMKHRRDMCLDKNSLNVIDTINNYSNITNFLVNYKAIEGVLNNYCKWTYSTMTHDIFDFFSNHFDKEKYAGDFSIIDKLPDGHPGPLTNEIMKEKYLKKLI